MLVVSTQMYVIVTIKKSLRGGVTAISFISLHLLIPRDEADEKSAMSFINQVSKYIQSCAAMLHMDITAHVKYAMIYVAMATSV